MSQSRLLWIGHIALVAILTGLIVLNPNRFTSIDSGYYLQSATSLLAGRGYVIQENDPFVWNGTFPIGYSALIAFVSGLTGFPVLVASKVVNFIVIGVSGYRWVRRLGSDRAFWVLSIWMLGGFLKIAAYTWSETVFLVLLAEWVWHLHQFLMKPNTGRTFTLFLIGYGLFLTRYVGGFVFGLTSVLAIPIGLLPNWFSAQSGLIITRLASRNLSIISLAGLACMSAYLGMNHQFSGSFFGGERFVPTESTSELAKMFGLAILNELLLIRDFGSLGSNKLAWFGIGIQFLLLTASYRQLRQYQLPEEKPPIISSLVWSFILTGGSYLTVLFTLRIFSPFSSPNLRLMAPFTFCLLMAACLWIGKWPISWQQHLRTYWVLLLLFSWLQLLPQSDISQLISQVWSWYSIIHLSY